MSMKSGGAEGAEFTMKNSPRMKLKRQTQKGLCIKIVFLFNVLFFIHIRFYISFTLSHTKVKNSQQMFCLLKNQQIELKLGDLL